MAHFIAEYRLPLNDGNGGLASTFARFEADTVQLAQREVERVIDASRMEEGTLYQAVSNTKATRVVSSTSVHGQKVVIGSGLAALAQDEVKP